jgi:excisionase family DNA binding protein
MCDSRKRKLLRLSEVAEETTLHRSTISRLIKSGELPCVQIRGRKLVREIDLDAFIENNIGVGDKRASGRKGVN